MPALLVLAGVVAWIPRVGAREGGWRLPPRGVAVYERRVERFVYRLPQPKGNWRTVLRTAVEGGELWRYTTTRPEDAWKLPDYDDAAWDVGRSGFGSRVGEDEDHRTAWRGEHRSIWLRAAFDLGTWPVRAAVLTVSHDDGVEVFLNGELVAAHPGFETYTNKVFDQHGLGAFRRGRNVLAVRCRNERGPQFVDVGLRVSRRRHDGTAEEIPLQGHVARAGRNERNSLFGPLRPPPLLFQSDLDARQQRPTTRPWDLREVARYLAFDLRGSAASVRSVKETIPRVQHFGDLFVRGKVGRLTTAGDQRLTFRFSSGEPDPRGEPVTFVRSQVLPRCRHRVEGTLRITRRLDPVRGVVEGFSAVLDARVRPPAARDRRAERMLLLEETWKLRAVRENRDVTFRRDVAEAIRRGARWIAADLADPQAPHLAGRQIAHLAPSANTGRLALGLLTLLVAGVDREDPVVARGLAALRRREILDTYSLAHAILAIEALYAPVGERDDLLAGRIDRPRPRVLSRPDRALVRAWAKQLRANVDTRVDDAYLVRFNYTPGPRYDHSNTQYGLLGLYAAHLCGIRRSSGFWIAAAEHLLAAQVPAGESVLLRLRNRAEREREERGATRGSSRNTVVKAQPTLPAGWGYTAPPRGGLTPLTGSMTAAGLTGLVVCRAALRDLEVPAHAPILARIDEGLRRGFAWIAAHFDVGTNPGHLARAHYWRYYYLYALERACELSGVELIGERDWYFEGAMTLLSWQREDGEFLRQAWHEGQGHPGGLERTCFAVLFLKKSVLPVYTLRGR